MKKKQLRSSCKKCSNGPFVGCAAALVVVLLFSMASTATSCTEGEKGSLLQFLDGLSSDGGLAASWRRNSTDCCVWEGIACGADGSVTDVSLASKGLEGRVSPSLGNLAGLLRVNLSDNSLSGGLPLELVSSDSIVVLDVSFNRLGGDMQELPSSTPARPLQVLNISSNLFTGGFPSTWKVMNNLVAHASNNSFTGQVPSHFCSSSSLLAVVELCYNQFTGSIPPGLGNCSMLRVLKAGHNNLRGTLPNELFDASLLEYLSLPDNDLNGELDGVQIIKLRNLANLNLGGNNFSGKIPDSIGQLRKLEELHLDHNNMSGNNKFTGVIPEEIGQLNSLVILNFSSNSLSGEIPQQLCNLINLRVLDLSSNRLTDGVQLSTFPNSSFEGNPKLCGHILRRSCDSTEGPSGFRKHWSKRSIMAITFGVFFGGAAILFVLGGLLAAFRHNSFITKNGSSNNGDVEVISVEIGSEESLVMVPRGKGEESNLTFSDIVKATNNFHQENIIGCGGYGLVYKADLPDGLKLAIKKLNDDMCLMYREFTAEVDALSMAQHDNLVPLWGYGIQGDSRFLIYPYMENGSLDDWLHNGDGGVSSFLDWPTRLKIAQGASRGLSYIHGVCKPHIVHRDIKSSNVLLDKEFKAYVADFGLSRLIDSRTHFTTELVGTPGYIPPEYGQGWVATLRGDMYSFGMVLLELLTGRRPVLVLSSSKELVSWVQEMKSEGKQLEVLDPTLRGTRYEEQMLKVLEAACKCVHRNPFMRPTIQEVVSLLESIDTKLQTQNSVKIESY
ncbi:hypothetical protein ZWY2020_016849 [Hordeum vulgare]|nr:hypothetical protein ZWY2020_016849 [Hordeum vulgare]